MSSLLGTKWWRAVASGPIGVSREQASPRVPLCCVPGATADLPSHPLWLQGTIRATLGDFPLPPCLVSVLPFLVGRDIPRSVLSATRFKCLWLIEKKTHSDIFKARLRGAAEMAQWLGLTPRMHRVQPWHHVAPQIVRYSDIASPAPRGWAPTLNHHLAKGHWRLPAEVLEHCWEAPFPTPGTKRKGRSRVWIARCSPAEL